MISTRKQDNSIQAAAVPLGHLFVFAHDVDRLCMRVEHLPHEAHSLNPPTNHIWYVLLNGGRVYWSLANLPVFRIKESKDIFLYEVIR